MEKNLSSWGLILLLDLYDCDANYVRDKFKIKNFPKLLCKRIGMKPYGKTLISRFGQGDLEGYSAFQFIETSTIVIHNDEIKNRMFIDIFSCKDFDPVTTMSFCKDYFKSKIVGSKVIKRGVYAYTVKEGGNVAV